jgi:hypothetical protein
MLSLRDLRFFASRSNLRKQRLLRFARSDNGLSLRDLRFFASRSNLRKQRLLRFARSDNGLSLRDLRFVQIEVIFENRNCFALQ